jgi:hypothetical protein
MTKPKHAKAVVSVLVGTAVGLAGWTTPAAAIGTGTAVYTCTYVSPLTGAPVTVGPVTTRWQHGTTNALVLKTDLTQPVVQPVNGASTVVNGVTVPNSTVILPGQGVVLGPAVVPGAIVASNPLYISATGIAGGVTCTLFSSSGFPI